MGFSIARCSPNSRKNVQSFAVEFGQTQRVLIDHVAHARTVPKNPTIASLVYEPEVRLGCIRHMRRSLVIHAVTSRIPVHRSSALRPELYPSIEPLPFLVCI